MAKFYPENLTYYNLTKSEELLIDALKNSLSDEYYIFYSLKWIDVNGESEVDLLIFHKDKGFLCIEVKGGVSLGVINNKYYLDLGNNETRFLKRSPHSQAEASMYYLLNQYKETYNKDFNGIYGFVAAFPFYNFDSSYFDHNANRDNTINMIDIVNIGKKIEDIFNFYYKKRLFNRMISLDDNNNFLNLLNKTISMTQIKGGHNLLLNKQIEELTRTQEMLINFLSKYEKAIIVGPAGTGKTYLAYKILKNNCGKNILFLTANNNLIKKAKELINCNSIIYGTHTNYINNKYDIIVVDEGQDLNIDSYYNLKQLSNSFYIFFDINQQSDSNVKTENIKDILNINYPEFTLIKNVRNTSNIAKLINKKFKINYYTNNIDGSKPEETSILNEKILLKHLLELIKHLVLTEQVPIEKITILYNELDKQIIYSIKQELKTIDFEIKNLINHVNDFKGLENDIIIYINNASSNYQDYLAYTRARVMLYILNIE